MNGQQAIGRNSSIGHRKWNVGFMRWLVLAVVAAASVFGGLTLLPGGMAEAHSAMGVPYHQIGFISCGRGTLIANPPRDMRSVTGGIETVYWEPELFKYNTSTGWQPQSNFNWASAHANGSGVITYAGWGTWFDTGNAGSIAVLDRRFTGLTPGYYAVKNWLFWGRGGIEHQEFSTFCYVS